MYYFCFRFTRILFKCYSTVTISNTTVWLGGLVVGRRISDQRSQVGFYWRLFCSAARCNSGQVVQTMCLCLPSSINWYRLRLGVKCTTGAVLGMLTAVWQTLRLEANRHHSSSSSSILWLPLYSGLDVTFVT